MKRHVLRLALFTLALSTAVLAQCTSEYNDASYDGTNLSAWTMLDDYYTSGGGCSPGWGSFTHTYQMQVTITSVVHHK
jgi:hypothetical protein